MNQNFETNTNSEKWIAVIKYIHIRQQGWWYFLSVLDLHSKKIVGYLYNFHKHCDGDTRTCYSCIPNK